MANLEDRAKRLLNLQKLLVEFSDIERMIFFPDGKKRDRFENNAEHSYSLAITAWYLAQFYPHLNKGLLVNYALVHDLVELHAGDEMVLGRTPEAELAKKQREHEAFQQLSIDWHDFPDCIDLIAQYEEKADSESRFIYALDKIMPDLLNLISDGKGWKYAGATPELLFESKDAKIATSEEVDALWREYKKIFTSNPELFKKDEPHDLMYCTTNEIKFRAGKRICDKHSLVLVQKAVEVEEIQSTNADKLIHDKATKIFREVGAPVVVNDHFWEIPTLSGFPGAYAKDVNRWFKADDYLSLMRNKENRSIYQISKLCYKDASEIKIFTSRTEYRFLEEASKEPGISLLKAISSLDNPTPLSEIWSQDPDKLNIDESIWEEFVLWFKEKAKNQP